MLEDTGVLFALGILYLALIHTIGYLLNRYLLRNKTTVLMNFIFGYFSIAAGCAIFFTGGVTIAWGIVAVLIVLFLNRPKQSLITGLDSNNEPNLLSQNLLIAFLFFTFFFTSRYSIHFNSLNGFSNIPYRDYVFYINHAEYFYLTGIENKLTSKHLLFTNLNFMEPYRFQDAWPMSLFLFITPYKSIDIYYQLVYVLNFSLVAYAIYELLLLFRFRLPQALLILFAFLFVFYQSGDVWPYKIGVMMMGVAGYTKLWLHFIVIICCLKLFSEKQYTEGNALLLLLFFTVPITLAIPLYIFLFSLYLFYTKKKQALSIHLYFVFLCFLYAGYIWNQKNLEKSTLLIPDAAIQLSYNLISYIKAAGYLALTISYVLPSVILYGISKILRKKFPFTSQTLFPLLFLLACGYVLYVVLHNTNDAVQLFTNIASPVGAVVSFVAILFLINEINIPWLRTTLLSGFTLMLVYETADAHLSSKHYAREDITALFDGEFLSKSREVLKQKVTNPVGIYYPESKYGVVSEQHVRDIEFDMTLLMGRYYDVVNIKGDSILFDDTRYTKIDRDWHRMAINIYAKRNPGKINIEQSFIKDCNIQFMLSKLDNNQLPQWINGIITETLTDSKSGLKLYLLNPALAQEVSDSIHIRK